MYCKDDRKIFLLILAKQAVSNVVVVKGKQAAVNTYEQDRADFDSFAAVIRKYVGIKELTPAVVNEFVKKIIVHVPDKSSGHRRQKIRIV